MPLKPWKKPSEVKRLTIGKTRIGGYACGDVFTGRLRFNDDSVHRVAVKVSKVPISDRRAMRCREMIQAFREAGVRLPKMDLVKVPTARCPQGEWVQVSQLFGSTKKGSKIVNKSWLVGISTARARIETIQELTKAGNTGYFAGDLIEPFKDISKGIIPIIDLDLVASNPASPSVVAFSLKGLIEAFAHRDFAERAGLFDAAIAVANPALKAELIKLRSPAR